MSGYTKKIAAGEKGQKTSAFDMSKHTGFGHIDDSTKSMPIDSALAAGYSDKVVALAGQLKYQHEHDNTTGVPKFEDSFYLQYAKRQLDSNFDSLYDKVLGGLDVAPDPAYAQYSYDEIIAMANNGVNIPKAVLAWAKAQQEADVVDYVVVNDDVEYNDEHGKDENTGESEVNKIRAEVKDNAIKAKKAQEDIAKNSEKTDELTDQALGIAKEQKNIFKNNSIEKTEQMANEWKALDKKKKDEGKLDASEEAKYKKLSEKLQKNGEIIQDMKKKTASLDSFLESIDNLTEETAEGLITAQKTISSAASLSDLDDRLNIFLKVHAYKIADKSSGMLEDTLSNLDDAQLAFVSNKIGHDLEDLGNDTADNIKSEDTQEVVQFADDYLARAKHVENILGIEDEDEDNNVDNAKKGDDQFKGSNTIANEMNKAFEQGKEADNDNPFGFLFSFMSNPAVALAFTTATLLSSGLVLTESTVLNAESVVLGVLARKEKKEDEKLQQAVDENIEQFDANNTKIAENNDKIASLDEQAKVNAESDDEAVIVPDANDENPVPAPDNGNDSKNSEIESQKNPLTGEIEILKGENDAILGLVQKPLDGSVKALTKSQKHLKNIQANNELIKTDTKELDKLSNNTAQIAGEHMKAGMTNIGISVGLAATGLALLPNIATHAMGQFLIKTATIWSATGGTQIAGGAVATAGAITGVASAEVSKLQTNVTNAVVKEVVGSTKESQVLINETAKAMDGLEVPEGNQEDDNSPDNSADNNLNEPTQPDVGQNSDNTLQPAQELTLEAVEPSPVPDESGNNVSYAPADMVVSPAPQGQDEELPFEPVPVRTRASVHQDKPSDENVEAPEEEPTVIQAPEAGAVEETEEPEVTDVAETEAVEETEEPAVTDVTETEEVEETEEPEVTDVAETEEEPTAIQAPEAGAVDETEDQNPVIPMAPVEARRAPEQTELPKEETDKIEEEPEVTDVAETEEVEETGEPEVTDVTETEEVEKTEEPEVSDVTETEEAEKTEEPEVTDVTETEEVEKTEEPEVTDVAETEEVEETEEPEVTDVAETEEVEETEEPEVTDVTETEEVEETEEPEVTDVAETEDQNPVIPMAPVEARRAPEQTELPKEETDKIEEPAVTNVTETEEVEETEEPEVTDVTETEEVEETEEPEVTDVTETEEVEETEEPEVTDVTETEEEPTAIQAPEAGAVDETEDQNPVIPMAPVEARRAPEQTELPKEETDKIEEPAVTNVTETEEVEETEEPEVTDVAETEEVEETEEPEVTDVTETEEVEETEEPEVTDVTETEGVEETEEPEVTDVAETEEVEETEEPEVTDVTETEEVEETEEPEVTDVTETEGVEETEEPEVTDVAETEEVEKAEEPEVTDVAETEEVEETEEPEVTDVTETEELEETEEPEVTDVAETEEVEETEEPTVVQAPEAGAVEEAEEPEVTDVAETEEVEETEEPEVTDVTETEEVEETEEPEVTDVTETEEVEETEEPEVIPTVETEETELANEGDITGGASEVDEAESITVSARRAPALTRGASEPEDDAVIKNEEPSVNPVEGSDDSNSVFANTDENEGTLVETPEAGSSSSPAEPEIEAPEAGSPNDEGVEEPDEEPIVVTPEAGTEPEPVVQEVTESPEETVRKAVAMGKQPQDMFTQTPPVVIAGSNAGNETTVTNPVQKTGASAKSNSSNEQKQEKVQIEDTQKSTKAMYGKNVDFAAGFAGVEIATAVGLGPTTFAMQLAVWGGLVAASVLDLLVKKLVVDKSSDIAQKEVQSAAAATKALEAKSKEIIAAHEKNMADAIKISNEYKALNDQSVAYQFQMMADQAKLVEAGKISPDEVIEFPDPYEGGKQGLSAKVQGLSDKDSKNISTINEPYKNSEKVAKQSNKSNNDFSGLNDKLGDRNSNNNLVGDLIIADTAIAQGLITVIIAALALLGMFSAGSTSAIITAWALNLAKNAALAATGVGAKLASGKVSGNIDANNQTFADGQKSLSNDDKVRNDIKKVTAKASLDKMGSIPVETQEPVQAPDQGQDKGGNQNPDNPNAPAAGNAPNANGGFQDNAPDTFVRKDSDTRSGFDRSSLNAELDINNPNDVKKASEYAQTYTRDVNEADEKSKAGASTNVSLKGDTTKADIKLSRFNRDGAMDSVKRSKKVNAAAATHNGRKRR